MKTGRKGCARWILTGVLALVALCMVLGTASALVNRGLPRNSAVVERLSDLDKARLAEAFHLRQTLGDQVLPGWSQADIPVVLYNEQNLFLTRAPDPAPGWEVVPSGRRLGVAWQPVPGDLFAGQPYYQQPVPATGQTTQGFTVRVGDRWVASLGTFDWVRIKLTDELSEALPGPLPSILPVGPYVRQLLMPGSDPYVTTILHEAVHAYQGLRDPGRLAGAEQTWASAHKQYPWDDAAFQKAWQNELDLLNQALRAPDRSETVRLARAFLAQRAERRSAAHLANSLVDLERLKEWEEGIGKYGELSVYVAASQTPDYRPLPELAQDPDFHNYRGAQQKWDQEVAQIRRSASDDGETRFYYAGFAQAVLLDRLSPGWKDHLFDGSSWLETMLAEAVK